MPLQQQLFWIDTPPQHLANSSRQLALASMRQIDQVSNQRWHFFRKLLNDYDFDSREIATNRAFYKLWELLAPFCSVLKDECKTLHLAEAPGSFVQVLKTMRPHAYAVAISKPPCSYADVVKNGKAIPTFSPQVTSLGGAEFHYVDLLLKHQIQQLVTNMQSNVSSTGFALVTADGGFDEGERYDEKEVLHYELILGEVVSILLLQQLGGSCVLKIFDTFTITTISILWLLCRCYDSYTIVKPLTSRPTNSERYIVCHNFKGCLTTPDDLTGLLDISICDGMVTNVTIPDHFIAYITDYGVSLAGQQADAIRDVLAFMAQNEGAAFIDKREFVARKGKAFQSWKQSFGYG